jgi:hypothetical protein
LIRIQNQLGKPASPNILCGTQRLVATSHKHPLLNSDLSANDDLNSQSRSTPRVAQGSRAIKLITPIQNTGSRQKPWRAKANDGHPQTPLDRSVCLRPLAERYKSPLLEFTFRCFATATFRHCTKLMASENVSLINRCTMADGR